MSANGEVSSTGQPSQLATATLNGALVAIQPLAIAHVAALARVGLHPELWRLQPRALHSEGDMQAYVERALDEHARGTALPFVIVRRADGAVIGSTRLMEFARAHRRVEIGATWLAPEAQRTGANVEAKWLLLRHAFETIGMQKVVFKTERLNTASRAAIVALGATVEGTFRRHLIAEDGRMRDMVYYSIQDDEWPGVQVGLRNRLERFESAARP